MSIALLAGAAQAQTVTFDFSDLGFLDFDNAIGNYMSDVYGSEIETDGAVSSNDRSDVGVGERNFFIATSVQLLNRGDFEIHFLEVPIIGAQFEGHIIDATLGDDFRFLAYSGNDLIESFTRNDGVEIFDSGWIEFSEPVNRIVVSDSGRRDVGIDDFTVQIVPDPATGLLLLTGTAFAVRRRKSKAG